MRFKAKWTRERENIDDNEWKESQDISKFSKSKTSRFLKIMSFSSSSSRYSSWTLSRSHCLIMSFLLNIKFTFETQSSLRFHEKISLHQTSICLKERQRELNQEQKQRSFHRCLKNQKHYAIQFESQFVLWERAFLFVLSKRSFWTLLLVKLNIMRSATILWFNKNSFQTTLTWRNRLWKDLLRKTKHVR